MKYQWLKTYENKTCEELSAELGCKVSSITKGNIIIGWEDGFDEIGNPIKLPITRPGIEIEFDKEPGQDKLESLDRKFTGLKREGGKDLAQEMDDIKARVDQLERSAGASPTQEVS